MSRKAFAGSLITTALAALVLGTLVRLFAQPAPPWYFQYDQPAYLSMASAPFVNTRDTYLPASWRILPPLVARAISELTGVGVERGFLIETFACFALLPIVAGLLLRDLDASPPAAIAGAAAMSVAPTVVGYFSWDVVRVDPLSLLLLFLAARAVVTHRPVTLVVLVVALSLTKETALLGAAFALAWAILIDRRLLPAAIACVLLAVVIRAVVLPRLIVEPMPFDNLHGMKGLVEALSVRYVLRRLLLATAATWSVMLPIAASGFARDGRWKTSVALLAGLAVAMAQILFASDTQRLVAAAYPFVVAMCAITLDGVEPRRRAWLGAFMVTGQLPWLLEYGRIVHIPQLRGIEIVLVFITAAIVVGRVWREGRGYFSPPKTAWPANAQ